MIIKHINTYFTDVNNDSIKVKLDTKPFIDGNVDDIVNWMVKHQFGNVNMEDNKTGETPFFIACLHNKSDDMVEWLITSKEANLLYQNRYGECVIKYMLRSKFNSKTVTNRIKLLLKYYPYDFIHKEQVEDEDELFIEESLLELAAYGGYVDVIKYLNKTGLQIDAITKNNIINKINNIINGKCNEYWTTDDVNPDIFYNTLDSVVQYLQI